MSRQSFSVTTYLKKILKKSYDDNPKLYRDIIKTNGEGAVSRHYVLCRNIEAEDQQMNSVVTRDNSIVTENGKKAA